MSGYAVWNIALALACLGLFILYVCFDNMGDDWPEGGAA